jgi:hypothetical protein
VSVPEANGGHELVVADDGSIPAEQLVPLGLQPGAHLRVIETHPPASGPGLAGSMPEFPELTWDDFERGE